jgi:hypothetical protein
MTDHSTLERRLRDASDPSVWDDVSPDAWQLNQRRVEADRARRKGRRVRVVAAAAAAVIAVGGGALLASQLGGSSTLPPSKGGKNDQDPFQQKNQVGKRVVLERFTANGSKVVHSAFLTRAGGKGLSLCDLYDGPSPGTSSGGSGSCTARSPDASVPKTNAIAFMTGSDSGDLRGVTGAVESRVASLAAWVGDSPQPRPVALHSLGVDGLQAFGVTTLGAHAPAVRIIAYDGDGAVLQIFDGPGYFGEEWLPDDDNCADTVLVSPTGSAAAGAGPVESVEAAATSIRLSSVTGPRDVCVPAPEGEAISKLRQGQWLVVVTGPEVTALRYQIAGQSHQSVAPRHFPRTVWGVVQIFTKNPRAAVTLDPRSAGGKVIGPMSYYRIPTD